MIPDEMLVYEPHHVGYARYGESWYRVIANYGGGDLVLAPQPAAQDEVDHKFCKAGCRKLRYLRKEKWLLQQPNFVEEEKPRPQPLPTAPRQAGVFRLGLALMAGFAIRALAVAFLLWPESPFSAIASETPSRVPRPGALHQHEKGWWRVEAVFAQEELAKDKKSAGRYQAYLQEGKLVIPYVFIPEEEAHERTAFLVLTPAHAPMGMMTTKGSVGGPTQAATPLLQPAPAKAPTKQGAPTGPPKGQWKGGR